MSRIRSGILSVGGLGTLVAAMAAIDDTFRGFLAGIPTAVPSSALASASASVQHMTLVVTETLALQTAGHGSLVVFALACGALILLMLRT